MIVSTKGRYALRVMIDLAEHQDDSYIPLREISARQAISEKYLESILKVLVQANLLKGLRGKGGGYKLTRSPDKITVQDVLALTEGSLAPVRCLEDNSSVCPMSQDCRTLPMWRELDEMVTKFFSGYTIADLTCDNNEFCYVI